MSNLKLGRIGIWSGELRFGDPERSGEAAAELEDLGFKALWVPGGADAEVLNDVTRLLGATREVMLCTGILNIWKIDPDEVGRWWATRTSVDQARLLIGLGVSHGPAIGAAYRQPLAAMTKYLDGLDVAGVPAEYRCLAALGPRMLELAAARTMGAHPYLVSPEHITLARAHMGPTALIATEVGVVVEESPDRARAIARRAIALYTPLPNYVNNWRRLGFTEDDISSVSDRLIDGLFAWGTLERIKDRLEQYLHAGADHVCVQVVRGAYGEHLEPPRDEWPRLAEVIIRG